jgi:hypothetical protein
VPPTVSNKLNQLAAATDIETALQLLHDLWDLIHGVIPGFPAWNWYGIEEMSLAQAKNYGPTVCSGIDWPSGDSLGLV